MDEDSGQPWINGLEPDESDRRDADFLASLGAHKSEAAAQRAILAICREAPIRMEFITALCMLPQWVVAQQVNKLVRAGELVVQYQMGIDGERPEYWTVPDEVADLKPKLRGYRRNLSGIWSKRRVDGAVLQVVRQELAQRQHAGHEADDTSKN